MPVPSTDPLTELHAGRVLAGRYVLGEPLGQGGSAAVFAARDTHLERDVAVKVWRREQGARAEARLTARLRHPGVVVVHDASSDGDLSFLVMERVHGVSLDTELGFGPLPERRARRVVEQLARTLALVHDDGFVHGDVKPANVLLGRDDQVTLADFGVAGPTRTRNRSVAVGTPHYLSPEQVRGRPVTPATDVYALGLVLLECLTGVRAYPGEPTTAALARLQRSPEVPADVSPDLAALLSEMTATEPLDRPAARAVAARVAGHEQEAEALEREAATQPVPTERGSWWALVGGALLAVVLVLALTGPDHAGAYLPHVPVHDKAPPVVRAPVPSLTVAAPRAAQARRSTPAPAGAPTPSPAQHDHGRHRGHR